MKIFNVILLIVGMLVFACLMCYMYVPYVDSKKAKEIATVETLNKS